MSTFGQKHFSSEFRLLTLTELIFYADSTHSRLYFEICSGGSYKWRNLFGIISKINCRAKQKNLSPCHRKLISYHLLDLIEYLIFTNVWQSRKTACRKNGPRNIQTDNEKELDEGTQHRQQKLENLPLLNDLERRLLIQVKKKFENKFYLISSTGSDIICTYDGADACMAYHRWMRGLFVRVNLHGTFIWLQHFHCFTSNSCLTFWGKLEEMGIIWITERT
jgi:hypothetical protein